MLLRYSDCCTHFGNCGNKKVPLEFNSAVEYPLSRNPKTKDEFAYSGEKCLFSLCLQKSNTEVEVPKITIKSKFKINMIEEILLKAQGPLRSEILFEMIWGTHPETKEDFLRLARLISKVRTSSRYEIIYKKGSYLIWKEKLKVS